MTPADIYTRWVMILAAIAPVAILVGYRNPRFALLQYVAVLVMTSLIAIVVDLLAPRFGGRKDFVAALKLSAYSYTAAFLAGVFHALGPWGGLLVLAASIYAWYTFYLGAPVLKKCSPAMAVPFTLVVVIAGIVLGSLFGRAAQGLAIAPL
jgi:hypothetical protein